MTTNDNNVVAQISRITAHAWRKQYGRVKLGAEETTGRIGCVGDQRVGRERDACYDEFGPSCLSKVPKTVSDASGVQRTQPLRRRALDLVEDSVDDAAIEVG